MWTHWTLVAAALALLLQEGRGFQRPRRTPKTSLSNKFIGVTTRCSKGSLAVDVRTQEAFHGSVYARGYPGRCRVAGQGNTTTTLHVDPQKCGVKVLEDQRGEHTYQLVAYIQFDRWVQQVIDEQVQVSCSLHDNQLDGNQLQAVAQMNVISRDPNENTTDKPKPATPDATDRDEDNSIDSIIVRGNSRSSSGDTRGNSRSSSSSGDTRGNSRSSSSRSESRLSQLVTSRDKGVSRSRGQEMSVRDWDPLPLPSDLVAWHKRRPEGNSEPVSCWMDIVAGDSMDGKPVLDHLLVGDDATMVLKVRQAPGLDTRVTSCTAHDGSGDQTQELVDENGCAIDDAIMPPLRVKYNPRTGLRVAYAPFKAFKFPDRDNLHLRCLVLVCLGACNLPLCGRTSNRLGRRMGGQGSITPVEDLDLPPRVRGKELVVSGKILDRVEVFNSVEVRAPGIETTPDLVKQYRTDRERLDEVDFYSEANLFCVTPYKMVLAFGVLLAVMLAALLLALYSCVRARYLRAPLRPPHMPHPQLDHHRRSPVAAPYYRFAH